VSRERIPDYDVTIEEFSPLTLSDLMDNPFFQIRRQAGRA